MTRKDKIGSDIERNMFKENNIGYLIYFQYSKIFSGFSVPTG